MLEKHPRARARVTLLRGKLRPLLAWSWLWVLPGCLAPSVGTPVVVLTATPNPSDNGSYAVTWMPIPGASKYRLHENGLLSYEGPRHVHAFVDKAAGAYTYSLTYCVSAFDIEACQVRPTVRPVTVVVAPR